jgi:hypothetical protein
MGGKPLPRNYENHLIDMYFDFLFFVKFKPRKLNGKIFNFLEMQQCSVLNKQKLFQLRKKKLS